MRTYEIIKDGKSDYHIVTSQYASAAERHAAAELQTYLYQATDVCVPFFSDRCPRRGPEILVGMPPRDTEALTDVSDLGEEGFLIETLPSGDIAIRGASPRGTLYGVFRFLELFLGFRCFRRDIEKIDHHDELILEETKLREKPAFEYREAYFRFAFDGNFASKNRLNANLAEVSPEQGGHTKFFNFHHSFDDLVPTDVYFETHPEYFAEIDGVRRGHTQLCLTNPDVLKIATDKVFEWIRENPLCRVFSVGQNDIPAPCTCERCRALTEQDGSHAGPMIRFVNEIAKAVGKEYPDLLIHTFAYQYTKNAPRNVIPEKNVIVRLCNLECKHNRTFLELERDPENPAADFMKNIRDWAKLTDRLYLWDYCINFKNYLQPFPNFFTMAENIKTYRDEGIKGVLEQGNFSFGGGCAMDDLKSYLIARLLWNPDLDVHELIDEFTKGVFGKGAPYVKEYIYKISEAVRGDHPMWIYDFPDAPYFNDALIEECHALFEKAERAAESDEIRARIEREHLSIKFLIAARLEDETARAAAVDALKAELTRFRVTEIRERINLYVSLEHMKKSRYYKIEGVDRGEYRLYYIMR